jgi:PAS domain S-box-containing protein
VTRPPELEEQQRELDETQAIAHIGSWSWDRATDRVTFSDELYRIYGLEPQSMHVDLETYLGMIIEEDRQAMRDAVARCAREGQPFLVTHRIVHPDGSTRWIEGRGRAFGAGRELVRMVGTCNDVTERQLYEDELRATLAEVRASRARIVDAGDAERRRVERDLHDGAQQRLVTLSMTLQLARLSAHEGGESELASMLETASTELKHALEELRDLAHGVHPALLADRGLGAALESLALRSPLPVTVSCPPRRLPEAVEVAAYYLIAESVTNAIKHSGASEVGIVVTADPATHRVTVEVADDGVGGADMAAGSGLRGLDDRAAALCGELSVTSPPGGGTTIRAVLPCA